MILSRVTFAMILAAAIESESPSPFTIASQGNGKSRTGRPSIRQWSGGTDKSSAARRIAR
jgi:hypothetical protein